MNPEGVGRLFVPLAAMADGPFPEHYEPIESPIANPLHPKQSNSPVVKKFKTDMDKYGDAARIITIVCTTYRLTEHYHYWTKNNPMNMQLVPEPFVEIPEELAAEDGHQRRRQSEGLKRPQTATTAKAMVTKRIKPMTIDGKETYPDRHSHSLGLPGIAEDEGRTSARRPICFRPRSSTPTRTHRSSRLPGENREG